MAEKMNEVNNTKETVEAETISYEKDKIELSLNLLNKITVSGVQNAQIVAQIAVILANPTLQ